MADKLLEHKKLVFGVMAGLIVIAVILLFAVTCMEEEAVEPPVVNYKISSYDKLVYSDLYANCELTLPKVVHGKNPEIEKHFQNEYNLQKAYADSKIGAEAVVAEDIKDIFDFKVYEVRGVTMVLRYRLYYYAGISTEYTLSWFGGMAFDNEGKIYNSKDIIALYGLNRADVLAEINGRNNWGFTEEHFTGYGENEAYMQLYPYTENSMLLDAVMGGDGLMWEIFVENGKIADINGRFSELR